MEQPSIELFGILIQEPVTAFTDLMITAICWWGAAKIRKTYNGEPKMYRYMEWFLWVMGLSTLLGGLFGHGFYYTILGSKTIGWIFSMVAILCLVFATLSLCEKWLSSTTFKRIRWVAIVLFVGLGILFLYKAVNVFASIYIAINVLFIILPLHYLNYKKRQDRGSLLMFYFVGLSIMPAFIFFGNIYIDKWFNHNDISHIFMMTSNYIAFKATTLFGIAVR